MNWPHAPAHHLSNAGAYIVTAGTYGKQHFFRDSERLTLLTDNLLDLATRYDWEMQAWAVFSNHYHFVANSGSDPRTLSRFVGHLHNITSIELNRLDSEPGRKVWFQ